MAKKIKKRQVKKVLRKPKKVAKQKKKQVTKKAKTGKEETRKVNWAALPGEEPTEEEYLDEDYPETEGFGTEEESTAPKKAEDDYVKAPVEQETVDEEGV